MQAGRPRLYLEEMADVTELDWEHASRLVSFDSYEDYFGKRVFAAGVKVAYVAMGLLVLYLAADLFLTGPSPAFFSRLPGRLVGALCSAALIPAMAGSAPYGLRARRTILIGTLAMLAFFHNLILVDGRLEYLPHVMVYFLLGELIIAPLLGTGLYAACYLCSIAAAAAMLGLRGAGAESYVSFALFSLPLFIFLLFALHVQRRAARELYAAAKRNYLHATLDTLSRLLNRRTWYDRSEAGCRSRKNGGRVSFIMLDIDHFKSVNDTYGHQAGDEVIRAVSRLLLDHTREEDIVGRLGGEEFGILLPDTDADGAADIAERIRRIIAETPVDYGGRTLRISASFGVAESIPGETGIDDLVKRGDECLYKAKSAGRNRVVRSPGLRP